MLPAFPTGKHMKRRSIAELIADLKGRGFLSLDPERVHRVDQFDVERREKSFTSARA